MNTPTPRTDALRTKLHESINTPNIVKYMETVLHANELETELTAAREELKAVTIERDEYHVKIEELAIKLEKSKSYKNVMKRDNAELRKQLTAAREEITLLKTNLKIQTNHTENAVQDRADEHIELHNQIQELTEQRDRLAEALERILEYQGRFAEEDPESIAKEALQSLTPKTSESI